MNQMTPSFLFRPAIVLISAAVMLTGCAPSASTPAPEPLPAPTASTNATVTLIEIDYTPDVMNDEPTTYTINCIEAPDSNYPAGIATVCRWLARELPTLASSEYGPVCTEQYGGPQEATLRIYQKFPATSGLMETTLNLSRHNGCAINQWNDWSRLLFPLEAELPHIKTPVSPIYP